MDYITFGISKDFAFMNNPSEGDVLEFSVKDQSIICNWSDAQHCQISTEQLYNPPYGYEYGEMFDLKATYSLGGGEDRNISMRKLLIYPP